MTDRVSFAVWAVTALAVLVAPVVVLGLAVRGVGALFAVVRESAR